MHVSISHSNANSQAVKSHAETIVSKYDYYKVSAMRINDEKANISNKYREAFRYWLKERELSVDGWCKKAGIREGALRNFLSGKSSTLLASNTELLAKAIGLTVGQLLREQSSFGADDKLMHAASLAIYEAARHANKKLTLPEAMAHTVELYNYVMQYRQRGNDIAPNEALAALIMDRNRA